MASKKVKVFAASLEKPHFRYILNAKVVYYPENTPQARHFHTKFVEMCRKFDRKKVQESFTWTNTVVPYRDLDKQNNCKVGFIDGSEWDFDFTQTPWDWFLFKLYWKNEELEGVRNVEGHDDEPEDEL